MLFGDNEKTDCTECNYEVVLQPAVLSGFIAPGVGDSLPGKMEKERSIQREQRGLQAPLFKSPFAGGEDQRRLHGGRPPPPPYLQQGDGGLYVPQAPTAAAGRRADSGSGSRTPSGKQKQDSSGLFLRRKEESVGICVSAQKESRPELTHLCATLPTYVASLFNRLGCAGLITLERER
ncbi:unnamed protein product [Notodromas monacha]|uniref:Uncharacterized protein n=1 Tax=Notodromas monacha TaxID=399045 RepID=A0A7R9BW22_9CRUS|nr:unnamed protein product [Notodromas monacha]CAG0921845.1 unnamed protein product [Notodromas monacha]